MNKCICDSGYREINTGYTYRIGPGNNPGDVIHFQDGSKTMIPEGVSPGDTINLYSCEP